MVESVEVGTDGVVPTAAGDQEDQDEKCHGQTAMGGVHGLIVAGGG